MGSARDTSQNPQNKTLPILPLIYSTNFWKVLEFQRTHTQIMGEFREDSRGSQDQYKRSPHWLSNPTPPIRCLILPLFLLQLSLPVTSLLTYHGCD